MDTFFAAKNIKKSSHRNIYSEIFITNKGFIYIMPIKSKKEVLEAVKMFAKEIEALEAIITNAVRKENFQKIK